LLLVLVITEEMKDLQIGTPFKTLIPSANHVAAFIKVRSSPQHPNRHGGANDATCEAGGWPCNSHRTLHNTVQVVPLSALYFILPTSVHPSKMRVSHLLPTLIAANAVLAAPSVNLAASPGELAAQAFDSASSWVQKTLAEAKHGFEHLENGIEGIKTEMLEVHGIECEFD
jgi:hypothetical protein